MKLSYRAAHYDYNPPTLEVSEGEILGKYRGAAWRCHTLQAVPVPQSSMTLKYRGAFYAPNEPADLYPAGVAQRVQRASKPSPVPNSLPVLKELAQVHRSNLQRNLERRLDAAKQRGDQTLVAILEKERNQLI